MPLAKQSFSIPPLNDQPVSISGTQITGGMSFSKGAPVIKFSIPAQARLLETANLFITGQMVVCNSDGSILSDLNLISESNGADLTKAGNLNWSNWGGIQNVINKVSVQSKKSSVELMNHNNYSMYQNIRAGNSNNDKDYLRSPLTRSSANGTAGKLNRHSVLSPDSSNGASGVMTNLINFTDENFGQAFSFRIDTALLNNMKQIHLGEEYYGGLVVTIHLNNDNGFFYRGFRDQDFTAGGQPNADVTGSFYRLKDLRLEGRYIVPTAQDLKDYVPSTVLNTRVNLINDVTSSTNISTYTPQLAAVKAFVNLFQDTNQQNNIARNQASFTEPLGLRDYTNSKNSIRAPEDYVIEQKPNLMGNVPENSSVSTGILAKDLQFSSLGAGRAEVRNRFQRSLFDGQLSNHTSASLILTDKQQYEEYQTGAAGTSGVGDLSHGDLLGIGLDYTAGVNSVSGFINQDYSLKVRSGVASGNANLPEYRRNSFELQETFARAMAVIDDKTLQMTM